jgi:hypothetical protein
VVSGVARGMRTIWGGPGPTGRSADAALMPSRRAAPLPGEWPDAGRSSASYPPRLSGSGTVRASLPLSDVRGCR